MNGVSKTTQLSVVVTPHSVAESPAQRVSRLEQELRDEASQRVEAMVQHLLAAALIAEEIASGGVAYKPGIKDISRRLAEELRHKLETIKSIQRSTAK